MENTDSQLDSKLKEIEAKLQEYTNSKGVCKNKSTDIADINKYLEMDRNSLRALSEEDCGEIAFVLGRVSLEIQRELNEQASIIKWLDAQIVKTISPLINNYKTYSYEGNKNAAIVDNDYAKKAFELKVRYDMRMTSLQYIAQEMKNLSSIILSIKDTKRRHNQNA